MAIGPRVCHGEAMNTQMKSVLRALEADPQPVEEIARKAGVSEREAANALEQLAALSLAILEEDGYELSGPLSWLGTFDAAVRYHARHKFVVTVPDDVDSHLYIDDVRVKGARKVGDPLTETIAVPACGRASRNVALAPATQEPTCEECRSALVYVPDVTA